VLFSTRSCMYAYRLLVMQCLSSARLRLNRNTSAHRLGVGQVQDRAVCITVILRLISESFQGRIATIIVQCYGISTHYLTSSVSLRTGKCSGSSLIMILFLSHARLQSVRCVRPRQQLRYVDAGDISRGLRSPEVSEISPRGDQLVRCNAVLAILE
jgi:hypothetical protein